MKRVAFVFSFVLALSLGAAGLTLVDAVKAGNRDAVRAILATPAGKSADNASIELVDVLLKAGADAKTVVKDGETVLMAAARTGAPRAVQMLIEYGAVVDARESRMGETALMWAVAENHPEAAKLLIAHGADVNARTSDSNYNKDRFGLEGVLPILPHGRWTPLMYAARQGSPAAAKALS